jgi:hypothetical protein
VACAQAPYYELTERVPIFLTFAALLYRDIAVQSELRHAARMDARARLRSWRERLAAPLPADVVD